jgi:hypothetical protein
MPQLKVLLKKESKGCTRKNADFSFFIGFIGVHLRQSAAETGFSNFLLRRYECFNRRVTLNYRHFQKKVA